MTANNQTITLPRKLHSVFAPPRGALRYRGAYGGRGSGKSFNFASMAAIWGYSEKLRILCTRELQFSIKESFYAELKRAIEKEPRLAAHYRFTQHSIVGRNGTEFLFRGLRHNMTAIKSMAAIDLCIVEEAEDVPESSWRDLIPTIRAPKSEIWVVWNPRLRGSAVDTRFKQQTPERSAIVQMNYRDNPWFPAELNEERRNDYRRVDVQTYAHIWDGEYLENSNAQVLARKTRIDTFEPLDTWECYFGIDFGFAMDPTAGVKVWIGDNRLWVEYEAGKVGLEIDHTAQYLIDRLPGIENYVSRADSARPESISYLKRHGLKRIEPVKKWQGSVEDGIAFLRSFEEIVFHPRCRESINESRLYSYATDKNTGDVLPKIVDAHNHYMDAIRYALDAAIRAKMKPVTGQKVRFNY